MSATRLLTELHRAGVRLWTDEGRLRYRGPESALTPEVIARMKAKKAELLSLLRRRREEIRPVSRDRDLPLSYHQQQLWLLGQLYVESPAYQESGGIRLQGDLDARVLRAAADEIVRRHEVLRTSFPAIAGQPSQRIASEVELAIPLVDLNSVVPSQQEAELERWMTAQARRPFDLSRGPLLRLTLLHLAPGDHMLIATFHHLIHDGESMKAFAGELGVLYTAFSRGEPSPLPGLKIQYADYACWQRRHLRGEVLAAEVDYWRRELEGSDPVLDLPLDHPRPPERGPRGGRMPFELTPELCSALRRLARREKVTLYMALLAALYALLHRYSGQTRFNVGIPRSGRYRAEVAGLLGFIVNTQALSADLSRNPSFRQLLEEVRARVLGAEAHPDLPFELLVEELKPERYPSVHPFFQVMFAYQEDPKQGIRLPGLELSFHEVHTGAVKFDLDFSVEDDGETIAGFIEYRSELFEPSKVRRLIDHYRRILEGAVEDADRRIGELELLSREERRQLLAERDDAREPAPPLTLHQRFELQAEAAPEQLALSAAAGRLSYKQLNGAANRLAHHLVTLGFEPGQRVAVMLDDGLLQAPTLLAVLKAGGVFLCPDRSSPPARLAEILREAAPRLLVTESAVAPLLWAPLQGLVDGEEPLELLELDAIWGELTAGEPPAAPPAVSVAPADPCYIAYTSGSTGKPKGIVQSHVSFCQFLDWQSEEFGMRSPARIAQWSALSYDAAYCEIFGALAFGATLCVPAPEVRVDPQALLRWLRREDVSLLQTVPSFCRQLLAAMESAAGGAALGGRLPALRTVMLSGEILPPDLATTWLRHFGQRPALFNLYGPSEAVLATWYPVLEEKPPCPSVPVGHTIPGRQILILDHRQQLCPVGIKGEIYIRSHYLTLGYFERPEETARSFIDNPLQVAASPDPVYRTGDLGRWLPGGLLEFCGRIDQQIKIRGMRVELGEIESALVEHPTVGHCAVTVHDGDEAGRLVAHVVSSAELAVGELKRHLRRLLPEHLVPAVFVRRESLPHTVTGKLDRAALSRAALPPQALERQASESSYVAPRTPLESLVADGWRRQLGLDRIGIHDNFFDLGGNSLSAVQLSHRLSETCGVELTLRSLLEAANVAEVASKIETLQTDAQTRDETVRRLLRKVQELSDSEVEALLAREAR